MARREKSPREKAARALCELMAGYPDATWRGHKMWTYSLHQADQVLIAALGGAGWQALVRDDAPPPSFF